MKFLLDQMKDMDWLDAKEMQEGYPLRGNLHLICRMKFFSR